MLKQVKIQLVRKLGMIGLATILAACASNEPSNQPMTFKSLPYDKVEKPEVMPVVEFMELRRVERERYMASLVQESFKRIDLLNQYISSNQEYIEEYNKILLMPKRQ